MKKLKLICNSFIHKFYKLGIELLKKCYLKTKMRGGCEKIQRTFLKTLMKNFCVRSIYEKDKFNEFYEKKPH